MKAVPSEAKKQTTPVIQVSARRPRQAAIQNFPHRWMTMKMKNSCTLQKCKLLVNLPTDDVWYHAGPAKESPSPESKITKNAASVSTPKT